MKRHADGTASAAPAARVQGRARAAWLPAVVLLACATAAQAGTQFVAGDLRSQANITGCGSGCALAAADSDATWAQWAGAAHTFQLANAAAVDIITFGFGGGTSATAATVAAGGLEPYLTLFDASGQFLASTYYGVTCPAGANSSGGQCFDVELSTAVLPAGSYTLVLSAYMNLSFAENLGSGLLADGYTGLGNLGTGESLAYAYDIRSAGLVPEPAPVWLTLAGLCGLLTWRRVRG